MASKKIYKHHERTTIDSALTDAQTREIVAGAGSKEVVYTWADGTTSRLSAAVHNVKDYGAKGDGVTDDTAAINAAILAARTSKRAVFFPAADGYIVTDTLALNSNAVCLRGEGPQNSIIYFSQNGKAAIEVSQTGNREYCVIENLGFSCSGTPTSTAIDASGSPNVIIRNIWTNNFQTGILLGNSWNAVVDTCRLVGCRLYGINAPSNTNDTCFINVIATCDDSANSRCMLIESCHGVSIKGGAFEDAEWAIEIQAGEVTFDGYLESCALGGFLVTSNLSYLNILNVYVFNIGTQALVRSNASNSRIIVQQARIETPSVELAYVFDMASGDASLAYGWISADETRYQPGGANFSSKVTGVVEPFIALNNRYTSSFGSSVAAAANTTLGNGIKFEVTAGTGTLNQIATTDWKVGDSVLLLFGGTVILTHNAAASAGFKPLFLVGAVTQTALAGDVAQFFFDGSYWRMAGGLRNHSNPVFSGTINGVNASLSGDLTLSLAGGGIKLKEGTNATMGRAVLVGGTVTVSTTKATTTMEVYLTRRITGGTVGHLSIGTVTAGTSFVINSTSGTETSTVCWVIIEPA